MLILSRTGAGIVLAAAAAGAFGYERLSPSASPTAAAAAKLEAPAKEATPVAAKPVPATLVATAAPEPPTPVEAPARMTPTQEAGFDAWLIKTYLGCWKPAPQPADSDPYVAQVRLAFNPDGSLARPAKLVNPPSDPALKPQARSVMAAVQNCNPLAVPTQYRPFYEQWRAKTLHFNPQLAGR